MFEQFETHFNCPWKEKIWMLLITAIGWVLFIFKNINCHTTDVVIGGEPKHYGKTQTKYYGKNEKYWQSFLIAKKNGRQEWQEW